MAISCSDYFTIKENAGYARWYHTNLHMHTPATPYDWNSVNREKSQRANNISPEDYFNELINTSLEVVAITDHNTVAWCEPLMKLALNSRKRGETKIHILPGVEITSYEGPHIIGVFDEDLALVSEIKKMLIRLGLSGEGSEDDVVGKRIPNRNPTICDIIEEIDDLGGIVIAPHIDSRGKGIWGNQDFSGRFEVVNHKSLSILAAPSKSIKIIDDEENHRRLLYKSMDSDLVKRSFAFINVSDCHRIEDFEKDTTWIKMSEPTVNGIRQIIFEPEERISNKIFYDEKSTHKYNHFLTFTEPEEKIHPCIIGMVVNGGYLHEQIIPFSPNQNCIIGKNYSGKSTIIDLLRFALNCVPEQKDKDGKISYKYQMYLNRLWALLTENGCVTVYIQRNDSDIFAVTRTLFAEKSRKGDPKYLEGCPTIFKLIGDEFHKETGESIKNVFTVEAYPQGEVVTIKDDASKQIKIIDNIADLSRNIKSLINSEEADENSIYRQLSNNGDAIVSVKREIQELEEEIEKKDGIELEITRLQEIINSSKHEELSQWDEYKTTTSKTSKCLKELKEKLSEIKIDSQFLEVDLEDEEPIQLSREEISEKLDSDSKDIKILSLIKSLCQSTDAIISSQIENLKTELDDSIEIIDLIEEYREKKYKEIYEDVSKAFGDEEPQQKEILVQRLHDYIQKKTTITSYQKDLLEKTGLLEELQSERSNLLRKFKKLKEEITQARLEIVNNINENASENVKAELLVENDKSYFEDVLEQVFSNVTSKSEYILQNKHQQISNIVESLSPEELAKTIRENDLDHLIEFAGVTENTAKIALLIAEHDINLIETTYVSDNLAIKFRKEGETDFTRIDAGLSGGEQALALISVAMIPKGMPLIIDQPEDELGPALITNELVDQVRKVKHSRQLIFVTHIPNIPVLGDSEQIICVKQHLVDKGKVGEIECTGSLDNKFIVEKLLELDGGEAAFKQRQIRYASVMN